MVGHTHNKAVVAWKMTWPMGQAFLISILVQIAMWLVMLSGSPPEEYMLIEASGIPDRYLDQWAAGDQSGHFLGPELENCRWVDRSNFSELVSHNGSNTPHDESVFYRIECLINVRNDMADAPALHQELEYTFHQSDEWSVTGFGVAYRNASTPELEGVTMLVFLSIPVFVIIVLLRGIPIGADVRSALYAIARKPWLLLAVPSAVILMNMMLTLSGAGEPNVLAHTEELRVYSTSLLALILMKPVLEEAIFRQWLYVRMVDRVPIAFLAVGSSWFFMLAHLLNPQTSTHLGYLVVVFVAGMVLFWIRHQYRSFTLSALAHVFNNALFLLSAPLME